LGLIENGKRQPKLFQQLTAALGASIDGRRQWAPLRDYRIRRPALKAHTSDMVRHVRAKAVKLMRKFPTKEP
jgi:hypothetical protein